MKPRRITAILLSVIFLGSCLLSTGTLAADGATVSINGGNPLSLAVGAPQANVPIAIGSIPSLGAGNGVGAFTFTLTWNRAVVNIESFAAASIGGWSMVAGVPDNGIGTVTIAGFASSGFLTANTTLATMTVKGMAAGTADISLVVDALGDKNGANIAATPQNCTVTVGGGGSAPAPAPLPTPTPTPTPTATPAPTSSPPPATTPAPATVKYTLTLNMSGKGSVNPTSGSTHNAGSSISLTATADSGWKFSGWSGDLSGSSSPASLTMNANKTVTATFTQVAGATYSLYVTVNGVGSSNPVARIEPYLHPAGATVSLTATPGSGWKFVSWGGDAANAGSASSSVVMNGNKYVVANFIQEAGPGRFNVKITSDGDGDTDPMPGSHNYDAGQNVPLKATPGPGWKFSRWNGSGIANPTSPSTTIFINGDKTIDAVFIRDEDKPTATTTPTNTPGSSKPAEKGPLGLEIWQFVLAVIGGLALLTGLGILLKKVIANSSYKV